MPSRATSASVGKVGGSAARARIRSSRQTKQIALSASPAGITTPGSNPAGVFIRDRASTEEPLVLPDDRQLDEFRAVVAGRRERDPVAAEVEVAQRFHRVDESLARQVAAGAAKAFDQRLGGDESFQAGERILLLLGRGLEQLLVLLDHRGGEIPREGHDLRYADAASFDASLVGQRLAADERYVHELRVEARRPHRLDERGAGFVRRDHDDRLRFDLGDRFYGGGDIDGVAFDGAGRDDLQVALVHRALNAGKTSLAIVIVLVENGDLVERLPGHLRDDLVGLVEIAGTDVEYVAVQRVAQRFGAGERADERNARRGENRLRRIGCRRADVAEQQEHAVVDQLLGIGGGPVGLVTIVERAQFDLAPVDAAGGVDRLEVGQRAGAHFVAELHRRSRERGRLPDQDRIRGDAGIGAMCRESARGKRQYEQVLEQSIHLPPQRSRLTASDRLPPRVSSY